MERMKSELGRLCAMSRVEFFSYLIIVGGAAGLLAWLLVFGLHFTFGIPKPTGMTLVFAIPRGSLFAVVLGLVLRLYWKHSG